MTYQELLPIYQASTGKQGSDDAFNQWVQGLVNSSGSQAGVDGIPPGFVTAPGQNPGPGNQAAAVPTQAVPPGPDMSALVAPGTPPPLTTPGLPALNTLGGNYGTNQVGGQTGGYTSQGNTNQTQMGNQSTNTNQNQNTTQNSTGTQVNNGVTTTAGGTTNKSTVDTPFDLSALVNQQLGTSGTTDTNRNNFLTDFMQNGGTGFNSQVDQAVRQAGSGSIGAGESGQARTAGYAAANVARNNAGDRLAAASQLAGPTATGQTISTFSPLFGKTDTGTNNSVAGTTGTTNSTGQTTGNSNTTGSSNTLDLQKLVGSETGSGTATGQSSQQAGGLVPQGQPVQSGGCVVCTAYVAKGMMKPGAVRRACVYKRNNWSRYGTSLSGYLFYGPFIARAVLYSDEFAQNLRPLARAVLYHEVHLSAPTRVHWKLLPSIAHTVFDILSYPVGLIVNLCGGHKHIRQADIRALLKSQNLEFTK